MCEMVGFNPEFYNKITAQNRFGDEPSGLLVEEVPAERMNTRWKSFWNCRREKAFKPPTKQARSNLPKNLKTAPTNSNFLVQPKEVNMIFFTSCSHMKTHLYTPTSMPTHLICLYITYIISTQKLPVNINRNNNNQMQRIQSFAASVPYSQIDGHTFKCHT